MILLSLVFLTGCMGRLLVIPEDEGAPKYAKAQDNVTFVFTIRQKLENDNEQQSNLTSVSVKIQTGKNSYATMLKLSVPGKDVTEENCEKGGILERYKGRVNIQYKEPNAVVHLNNIQREDLNWNYQLEAEGDIRQFKDNKKQIMLLEAVPPQIYNASFFKEVVVIKRGSKDTFICRATGTPEPVVTWEAGSKVRASGYGEAKLRVDKASANDSKNYFCLAKNVGGVAKKIMSLVVTYIDYLDEIHYSKLFPISKGGSVSTRCKIIGYPEPEYRWFDVSGNVIRTSRLLHVGTVRDFGNYTCEASNDAGSLNYVVDIRAIEERNQTIEKKSVWNVTGCGSPLSNGLLNHVLVQVLWICGCGLLVWM